MKPRDFVVPALLAIPFITYFMGRSSALPIPANATVFMHIKHSLPYPNTLGKVRQIYNEAQKANKTGLDIGLEPQCVSNWATQLEYYKECGDIPVMLNVLTSDDAVQLTTQQIEEAMNVCNVRWLRFHEALSWFNPFPTTYVNSIMEFARTRGVPIFWNEWDIYTFPQIATIIQGYEDVVSVSFGTNSNQLEPVDGFALLQQFQRRAASVQSWYWWERNGRQEGYQYTMPPELMRLHTQQAFQAGCEVVQYEPFSYFFDVGYPKITLSGVLGATI